MGLLSDIQASVLNDEPMGAILLKLRFLAARLGSSALADWVRHEAEGYPRGAPVPSYRTLGVSYTGSFNGLGRTITRIAIPSVAIVQAAGDEWLSHDERQSVSALEDLLTESAARGVNPEIPSAANLAMLLSGQVFPGMGCHAVHGVISRASLVSLLSSVRTRVLELTLEIEKTVPGATDIAAGQTSAPPQQDRAAAVTHITNQIINAPVGANVANSGANAQFNITVQQENIASLAKALVDGGIPMADAEAFAALVASEKPEGSDSPFGAKAKAWIADNVPKALNGVWKAGIGVATTLLTDATKQYYGIS